MSRRHRLSYPLNNRGGGGVRKLTRRELIQLGICGAGLTFGIAPSSAEIQANPTFQPSPLLRIDSNGHITVWSTKAEVGQGIKTALAMLVAEELDADWQNVRVAQAPYHSKYGDQAVGGSNSIRGSWEQFRKAGAAAR